MSNPAFIFTGNRAEDPAWLVAPGPGAAERFEQAYGAFSAATNKGWQTILVLPGDKMVMRSFETQARRQKDLSRVARFALDDMISESSDDFVLDLYPFPKLGKYLCLAAPQNLIDHWVFSLREAGFSPIWVSVDLLCLWQGGGNHCLLDDQRSLWVEDDRACVLPASQNKTLLPELVKDHRGTDKIYWSAIAARCEEAKTYSHDKGGSPEIQSLDHIYQPDSPLLRANPPAFLERTFSTQADWRAVLRSWRRVGYLALALLVAWLGYYGADGWRKVRMAEATEKSAAKAFAAAFPDRSVQNLTAEARRIANQKQGENNFLGLMRVAYEGLEPFQQISLEGVVYGRDGRLALDLRVPDFEMLESFKEALKKRGLAVTEGTNPRRSGDVVLVRLYLEEASQ